MMSTVLTPPQLGGSGTKSFSLATWNICCRRGMGMAAAAKGLVQMGVGIRIQTKTKITDDQYSKSLLGYRVIVSNAVSSHQGGLGLIWSKDHIGFDVKAVQLASPNLLTFQLITGNKWFYIMGIYISPNCTTRVDDLFHGRCALLTALDAIVDLLEEIKITNLSLKFIPQQCSKQWQWVRWTFRMRRGGGGIVLLAA